MQIIPTKAYSNNFKGKPLFPVTIKNRQANGNYLPAPAQFVELSLDDNRDVILVDKIGKLWIPDRSFINYSSSICRNFFQLNRNRKSKRFFAIQLVAPTLSEFEKTAGIMETTNPITYPPNYLEIDFLQSATSLAPGFRKVKAKGAGEQLVYGATRIAKNNDLDSVKIFSTNDEFYEKLGLKKLKKYPDGTYFIIENKDYDNFLSKVEEKYKN